MGVALGLDVGNAKLKLCVASAPPRWTSTPLPYDARRPYARAADFERGLPEAIGAFVDPGEVDAVVAVASHGYSYPTFAEATLHLADLLERVFPSADVRLLSGALEPVPTARVRTGDANVLGPLSFTNPLGAAHLARGGGHVGLVLDTGGSTTGVVVLAEEGVDPAALRDPARYVEHRVLSGKLTWIGASTTPLEALSSEVTIRGERYPVVPRGVPFEIVSVLLDLLPRERARRLGLFGLLPSRDDALRAMADAVGLDRLDERDALDLARTFHDLAVERLARALERARATAPKSARTRAMVYGLGARGLARPALLRAGYAERDVLLAEDELGELAEIASCYGAARCAAEVRR